MGSLEHHGARVKNADSDRLKVDRASTGLFWFGSFILPPFASHSKPHTPNEQATTTALVTTNIEPSSHCINLHSNKDSRVLSVSSDASFIVVFWKPSPPSNQMANFVFVWAITALSL